MTDPNKPVRLALIDDDADDRRLLIKSLRTHDLSFEFLEFSTFKDAMSFAKAPDADVVLLDNYLGDGYGLDLLSNFNAHNTPVILVTGNGSELVAANAMRNGAAGYLIKDVHSAYLDLLPGTIKNVVARRNAERDRDRLIKELQEALDTIQTLRGLIPICCACKMIRDDEGYWHSVEEYVSKHSLAQFSHGYCPDCLAKVMSELESSELAKPSQRAQS